MQEERKGPIIESRHHEGFLSKGKNPLPIIIAGLVLIVGLGTFFFVQESVPEEFEEINASNEIESKVEEENLNDVTNEIEALDVEEELTTAEAYYKRAFQKETETDYVGAVEDYTRTISLAKKYSGEMWNALNNRGIIYTEQFQDYRTAMKDFDKIIQIENNRYNGEVNEVRLEAGYTNRAYVKKMLGDKDGACDDLYEALALGVEASAVFIERQIDKNCL